MKTYEVFVGAVNGEFIKGPFAVTVIKDEAGKRSIVSSVSNIQTVEIANHRAMQYVDSFGASLPWGLMETE